MLLTQGVQRPDQGTSKQLSIRKGKAFELIKSNVMPMDTLELG
jgi:hypothetical protein